MTDAGALETQAAFATRHDVSRKTATLWKQKGYLILVAGRVDIAASDARLQEASLGRFRASSAPAERAEHQARPARRAEPTPEAIATPAEPVAHQLREVPTIADELPANLDSFAADVLGGRFQTILEADRVKANALAVKQLLELRRLAGELIEIAAAERVLFEVARAARDSWTNWPVRIGPLLAADLELDADKVIEALAPYVHRHLTELGEPEGDFADRTV